MKIKETSLSIGKTINLGNFESLRLDLSIAVDLDIESLSGAEYDDVVRGLEETLCRNLEAMSARQTGQSVEEIEEFI